MRADRRMCVVMTVAALTVSCRGGFDNQPAVDGGGDTSADAMASDGSVGECGGKTSMPISEPGLVLGTTTSESNEFFGTCSGAAGPEAVYTIEVDDAVLDISFRVTDSSFDATVYVRTDCGTAPASELSCSKNGIPIVRDVPSGQLFVFVDSREGGAGTFELETTLMDRFSSSCDASRTDRRCAVELECIDGTCQAATCGDAIAQTDEFSVASSTNGVPRRHEGTCGDGGALAPEVVYAITLSAPVSSLVATTDDPATSFDTLLYLRESCVGDEIACNDDVGDGNNRSLLTTGPLDAGTYFLFVDGFGDSQGSFNLNVTLTP